MRKLGMNAILGVGQGSERESQFVVMRWPGGGPDAGTVAFIGKGVTFDTGGISIQPAGGMEDLIWDMGGAGTVIGPLRSPAGPTDKRTAARVGRPVPQPPDRTPPPPA